MEERNPMEEQVEKEENSNQPESRMGKHNKRKTAGRKDERAAE